MLQQAGLGGIDVRPPGSSAPARAPRPTMPAAPRGATTTAAATDVVHTAGGSDAKLYFILTQMAGLQNSGVAPSSFFHHLAAKAPAAYRASLEDAAARVGEGTSISEVLARYPNLYPRHVIADIRIGEKSGYVGEAMTVAADSVDRARRLNSRLAYFPFMAAAMLVVFPLSLAFIRGSLDSMKAQDKAGGALPVSGTIQSSVLENLRVLGPVALGMLVVLWIIGRMWKQPFMRPLRHRLGFALFPGRARAEAVTRLSWGISRCTHAALPHYAAYQLAVEAIPNDVMRDRAVMEAMTARENEPLSSLLRRSNLLPPQYSDVVETGEMTGDVPRAMDQLANYAATDFDQADAQSTARGYLIFYVFLGLLTLVLAGFLFTAWYGGIVSWGTSDDFLNAL